MDPGENSFSSLFTRIYRDPGENNFSSLLKFVQGKKISSLLKSINNHALVVQTYVKFATFYFAPFLQYLNFRLLDVCFMLNVNEIGIFKQKYFLNASSCRS